MKKTDWELRELTYMEAEVAILWAVLASLFAVVPLPWLLQLPARPFGPWATCIPHRVAAPTPLDATSSDPEVFPSSLVSHAICMT